MEHVTLWTDRDDPSPGELKGYFAELFASLDADPRPLLVTVDVRNDRRSLVSIDYVGGEPVFMIEGRRPVKANFRGRYLAEHPVPLAFPRRGTMKIVIEPTSGNRVKVRRPTFMERIFG